MLDGSEHARMVPMLPCEDIDEMAAFWTALGLAITYRQLRPNPYPALVTRRLDAEHEPRSLNDRTEWVTGGGGPLARALENAVVLADSHGNQAQRTLAGAVARSPDAPVAERADAWAYLAELRSRLGDARGAQRAVAELERLAALPDLPASDREAVARTRREIAEL